MTIRGQTLHDERIFGETEQDLSPQMETVNELFIWSGITLAVFIVCLVAGIGWGLFERYYPSTVCMVKQLFSINCK